MTKIQKFPNFQRFNAFFVLFSINIVDKNVENVQHARNSLSSRLCEEIIAFSKCKIYQTETENDKKPETFKFSKFFCSFCQVYDRLRGLKCEKEST